MSRIRDGESNVCSGRKPGPILRRILAVYNLLKNDKNENHLTEREITPLDISLSNLSIRRPEIGEMFLLKLRPFLARDIFLDFLALFVPGSTQFLQHFLGSKK